MTRLLVLGLLLLIAIGLLVSRLQPYLRGAREFLRAFRDPSSSPPSGAAKAPSEVLVACAACGARVPASRALGSGGAVYCGPECRAGEDRRARRLVDD